MATRKHIHEETFTADPETVFNLLVTPSAKESAKRTTGNSPALQRWGTRYLVSNRVREADGSRFQCYALSP